MPCPLGEEKIKLSGEDGNQTHHRFLAREPRLSWYMLPLVLFKIPLGENYSRENIILIHIHPSFLFSVLTLKIET